MKKYLTILFCLNCLCSIAQNLEFVHKEIKAVRTNDKIKIDASIDEAAWKTATYFTDFVEWRPTYGKLESNKTEIFLLYNNDAFYIAGYCHENNIDSISKELVGRDQVGVNDFVGIILDTYHDKINGFGYFITPLGEQFDAKYSSTGEDGSWNSVYETKSKIVNDGWIFEMKIPYAAIRFVAKENQTWGINITRRRNKSGQQYMWNPVNQAIGGSFLSQFGNLTEINNIKPPVRLSFSPYLSVNTNHDKRNADGKQTVTKLNGGMDVKYGINQAYTLDMTLIPDFGQVQSDNQIQNLGPFEVQFNEYRTFFTEGTELFGKGEVFYSRRIGSTPVNAGLAYNLSNNDSLIENPLETKLINGTKVSGRNKNGLAIGVLNALTAPSRATIYNKVAKQTYELETSPLTNYNILVIDKTLKNNSSYSFINTNVLRSGNTYDANVLGGLFDIYDKRNMWEVSGKLLWSSLNGYESIDKTTNGILANYGFGKQSGRFVFWQWGEYVSKDYNQRDLGFQNNPNYFDKGIWMAYKWLKPKGWYNNLQFSVNVTHSQMVTPSVFQRVGFNTNFSGTTKKLWNFNAGTYFNTEVNDFYEARIDGYVFKRPLQFGYGFNVSTNAANKYSATYSIYTAHRPKISGWGYETFLRNQYRFNNKLTVGQRTYLDVTNNGKGFAGFDNGNPLIGLRQRIVVENNMFIKYNFNNVMGITFVGRHYWSKLQHTDVMYLEKDGTEQNLYKKETATTFFNYMNVDLTYTWQFALGSFITFNWKSIAVRDEIEDGYFKNLSNTLASPQNNNFNLKIIYFLDYLSLKKK